MKNFLFGGAILVLLFAFGFKGTLSSLGQTDTTAKEYPYLAAAVPRTRDPNSIVGGVILTTKSMVIPGYALRRINDGESNKLDVKNIYLAFGFEESANYVKVKVEDTEEKILELMGKTKPVPTGAQIRIPKEVVAHPCLKEETTVNEKFNDFDLILIKWDTELKFNDVVKGAFIPTIKDKIDGSYGEFEMTHHVGWGDGPGQIKAHLGKGVVTIKDPPGDKFNEISYDFAAGPACFADTGFPVVGKHKSRGDGKEFPIGILYGSGGASKGGCESPDANKAASALDLTKWVCYLGEEAGYQLSQFKSECVEKDVKTDCKMDLDDGKLKPSPELPTTEAPATSKPEDPSDFGINLTPASIFNLIFVAAIAIFYTS